MKKKVLISITAVALFGLAIAWSANTNKKQEITVHNAKADVEWIHGCADRGICLIDPLQPYETIWPVEEL